VGVFKWLFWRKIMRRIILSVFFVLGVSFAVSAFAENAALVNPKVGILDIDQTMAETGLADIATKKILKQYAPERKALAQEERALQQKIKEYNVLSDNLQPDEIKQWQHKIDGLQNKLQQKQNLLQEKIMTAEELANQKIIARFFKIVTKIAGKNNLEVVFFKDITVYNLAGAQMQDITDQVIKVATDKKKNKKTIL
jgi:Skp family chaperone for outer membrane proteins